MTAPDAAREREAREALSMAYCGRGSFRDATDAYRAAVRASVLSEVERVVEGTGLPTDDVPEKMWRWTAWDGEYHAKKLILAALRALRDGEAR